MLLRQILLQREDFFLEILDGEAFLYHLSDTRILYCNQTAILVWQLCDGKRSGEEIVTLLQDAFPEAGDALVKDVEEALQQFVEHKALEQVPTPCPND
jgi:hypothetical protein